MRNIVETAEKYIANLEQAFKDVKVKPSIGNLPVEEVLDQAHRYLEDAKYYLERGDPLTAIASSSYSEGLIDALRLLSIIEVSWRKARGRDSNG
jgi:FAD synthetase